MLQYKLLRVFLKFFTFLSDLRNNKKINVTSEVTDSQCGKFRSSGILCPLDRQNITDVSTDDSAFIFRVKQS